MGSLEDAYDITWPADLHNFAGVLRWPLEMWRGFEVQCMFGQYSYMHKFWSAIAVPVVLLVVVLAVGLVPKTTDEMRGLVHDRMFTAVSFLVFLVYPSISHVIFSGVQVSTRILVGVRRIFHHYLFLTASHMVYPRFWY